MCDVNTIGMVMGLMVHSHTLSLCILPSIGCTALDQRHVVCWGCWHWPSWWFCSNGSSMWSTVQGRELASRLIQHNHHHHNHHLDFIVFPAPLITSIITSRQVISTQCLWCCAHTVEVSKHEVHDGFVIPNVQCSLCYLRKTTLSVWSCMFVQWWLWECIDLCCVLLWHQNTGV